MTDPTTITTGPHTPWVMVVEVHEAGMVYDEVQVRCGCSVALQHDYGHERGDE